MPDTGAPEFEVASFEFVAPDRLVVTGRWFGVRGRRFVRPTLTVHGPPGIRPLLALLEHKPWAAEEDEEWIAAFPWDGGPQSVDAAELAVAPDIAVPLPAPVGIEDAPRRPPPRRRINREEGSAPAGSAPEGAGTAVPPRDGTDGSARGGTKGSGPSGRGGTKGSGPSGRGGTKGPDPSVQAELEAARYRIEELVRERDAVERERDNAIRSREAAYEARDAALAAREELRHERDALDRDVDAGVEARFAPERERLEAELAEVRAALDAMTAERDVAVAERDAALDAREAATVARKAAERELDEAKAELARRDRAAAMNGPQRRSAVDWTYRTLIVISIALALLLFGVVLSAFL